MLIDKKHNRWIVASGILFFLCLVTYIPYHRSSIGGPTGATFQGIIYAFVGSALMLFAGLLGARKRIRIWRLGRAQEWVRGHIWLGLVSFPIILFHSGMSFGQGRLTLVIMWLFVIVITSGIIGMILHYVIPRMLIDRVPRETIYEQIPNVINQLREEADDSVQSVCGEIPYENKSEEEHMNDLSSKRSIERKTKIAVNPMKGSEVLKDFYLAEVRPFFTHKLDSGKNLMNMKISSTRFAYIRTLIPTGLHDTLDDLETLAEERRELILQEKLHHWLHGWLLFHAPIAYALLALSTVHAVMSVFF